MDAAGAVVAPGIVGVDVGVEFGLHIAEVEVDGVETGAFEVGVAV